MLDVGCPRKYCQGSLHGLIKGIMKAPCWRFAMYDSVVLCSGDPSTLGSEISLGYWLNGLALRLKCESSRIVKFSFATASADRIFSRDCKSRCSLFPWTMNNGGLLQTGPFPARVGISTGLNVLFVNLRHVLLLLIAQEFLPSSCFGSHLWEIVKNCGKLAIRLNSSLSYDVLNTSKSNDFATAVCEKATARSKVDLLLLLPKINCLLTSCPFMRCAPLSSDVASTKLVRDFAKSTPHHRKSKTTFNKFCHPIVIARSRDLSPIGQ